MYRTLGVLLDIIYTRASLCTNCSGTFYVGFLKITTISEKNMFYILLNDKDKYRLLQFCYDFLDRVNICNIFRNN